MLSVRPWIGIALLAVSWLFGLDYYELPSTWAQAAMLALGTWMLAASERGRSLRTARESYSELTAAIVLCLLPVIWWTPWPYRIAPLAIVAGVLLERVRIAPRFLRPAAAGCVGGAAVLLLQAVALTIYGALTARSHDVPAIFVKLLAGLGWLAGIDAAGDGPLLVMQSMRQPIRLAITWDMVFDPVTMMFLVGGLAWIVIDAGRRGGASWKGDSPHLPARPGGRFAQMGTVPFFPAGSLARFALIVVAWLPIRAVLMVAIYLHRAALTNPNAPLHVANQFLSSWVLLAALAVPILLAWRLVPLVEVGPAEKVEPAASGKPRAPVVGHSIYSSNSVKYLSAAACCLFGAMLLAVGLHWEPAGKRKEGRVMFVERHAPWSPSDRPYDTEHFGGGANENSISYAYKLAYDFLGQYYEMSRLRESDAIDDADAGPMRRAGDQDARHPLCAGGSPGGRRFRQQRRRPLARSATIRTSTRPRRT